MIQTGDFVKLNYTGKLQDGTIFDTTKEDVAKTAGLHGVTRTHSITICVGQRMLIPGLDEALIGQSGNFSATIPADKAFGRKDPKLLKIVPTAQLLQQQIRPYPGMRLNVDGNYGTVRTVSPGRTVVDFNHPLASQDVTYDVEILGTVTDAKDQIKALMEPIGLPFEDVIVDGDKATVKLPQLFPQPVLQAITERIVRLTSVKTVSYEQGKTPEGKPAVTAKATAHNMPGQEHDHAGHDHTHETHEHSHNHEHHH